MGELVPLVNGGFTSVVFIVFVVCSVYDIHDAKVCGKRHVKPFLMPFIALYYCLQCKQLNIPIHWMLIVGLLFGCLGDIFLIKTDEKSFLCGLISFFLCHVSYLILFLSKLDLSRVNPWLLIAIIPYMLLIHTIYSRLKEYVPKEMIVPVKAYMVIIVSMSFVALLRYDPNHLNHFLIAYIGSLFFMLSDTILSFHIFAKRSHNGIMSTYILAQFLIMYSFLLA